MLLVNKYSIEGKIVTVLFYRHSFLNWNRGTKMNSKELIEKLLYDLKKHINMQDDLYLQKCEAFHTLYVRENDTSHALGIKFRV